VGHKILASEPSLFLIISSEAVQKLSGESSTFFFRINYSSAVYIVDEVLVKFSRLHFPHT
jgi:hypothetical protein